MKNLLITFCLVVVTTTACKHNQAPITIAPHGVVSSGASYDKNQRNSGLIYCDDNGCVVTKHFLDRHNLSSTNLKFEGRYFRISAQVMAECIDQDQNRKNVQH